MDAGVVTAVVVLGVVHGVLPDHGWPIAATYALNYPRRWVRGTIAALVLGVGHLISSVALVLAYFWFSRFAEFAEGPWIKPVAGSLLIALGIYEYASGGHGHHHDGDGHGHDHSDDHDHSNHSENHHDPDHHQDHHDDHHERRSDASWLDRLRASLPGGGHAHLSSAHADGGLVVLGTTALVLGFAHEEPIQILAICAGTPFCLELMLLYSLAVIGAILVPTLVLIAGYEHHQERIERFTPYLPTITAAVLIGVGLAFVVGLL